MLYEWTRRTSVPRASATVQTRHYRKHRDFEIQYCCRMLRDLLLYDGVRDYLMYNYTVVHSYATDK